MNIELYFVVFNGFKIMFYYLLSKLYYISFNLHPILMGFVIVLIVSTLSVILSHIIKIFNPFIRY